MSLAEIRAKLMAQENRSQQNQTNSIGDNAVYPFWNMPENSSSSIRFLPDGDTNNSFFWIERAMIKLPFVGVKGQNESKQVIVQVPCVEMYGDNCPILAEVRTWYKDESLKEMANKYWKKRTYLFQGFVRSNSVPDDNTPENPIRRFLITSQLFTIIKASLMDPEIEELPTDYVHGLDFNIKKTKKGEYADYATSTWARKESALSDAERAAIDAYGLFNLREFLPKKPSETEMRIIRDMFEASVDGRLYDPDKWAAYFKPWGLQVAGSSNGNAYSDVDSSSSTTVSKPVVKAPVVQAPVSEVEESAPWDTESTVTEAKPVSVPQAQEKSTNANDILAMIRARQNKTA
jgi:gp32 DNA binding protein like